MDTQQQQQSVTDAFRKACDDLAEAVNRQLFDGSRPWYWIAGDAGGACDFDDTDILNSEDMVRILDAGMTYDEYAAWRDANIDNTTYINLRSWLRGLRHDMIAARPQKPGLTPSLRQEFVRSLWHSTHEEPRTGSVLCRCRNINPFHPAKYSYYVCDWTATKAAADSSYGGDELKAFRNSYWAANSAVKRILNWCYLSDILPDDEEEGGEE